MGDSEIETLSGYSTSSLNDTEALKDEAMSDGVDSDQSTPKAERDAIHESNTSCSSWGSDDPPDSQDYSCDTSDIPEWKKDPSYSEDSSLFSEDLDTDSASSYSEDHLHVHPEKDPVQKKPPLNKVAKKPPVASFKTELTGGMGWYDPVPASKPFSVSMFLHGHHFSEDIYEVQGHSNLRIQN